MFDTIIANIHSAVSLLPFSAASWFVIGILILFGWLFGKADRDPKSPVKWEHLIVDSSNDRVSPYKMGYLVGALVGTWIVVSLADAKLLSYDVFGMYLTYLLGGAGMNTFFKAKGSETNPGTAEDKDLTASEKG